MRLSATDLRFGYMADRLVLDGVTLSYESPGVMCVLGTNGTGKSTLLRNLTGELRPASGTVELDGRPVGALSPRELARKLAYLAQTHAPTFSYSVLDVVTMGRTAHMGYLSSPGREDVDVAREQLDYLGIARIADRPYTDISGGERQLVMLAAALAQEPEALLLDEPTSHLDFGNQYRFVELMGRLAEQGMGVLMTTHFPDHALMLDCPTAVLRDGRVQALGPAREVVRDQTMSELYGVPVTVARVGDRLTCVPGPVCWGAGPREGVPAGRGAHGAEEAEGAAADSASAAASSDVTTGGDV